VRNRIAVVAATLMLIAAGAAPHGALAASPQAKPAPQRPAAPAAKAAPPAATSGPAASPAFDGNVASIVWGGRIESVTGLVPEPWHARSLINEKETQFRTEGWSVPTDIVVSFFKREPVLVQSVHIVSAQGTEGVREVEIWTSMAGPDTGFSQVASGTIPHDDNVRGRPESTFTFPPIEARFVKVRLVSSYDQRPSMRGWFRLARIRVYEAQAPGYVPLLTRHPEIAAPVFVAEGTAAEAAAKAAPAAGCSASAPPVMQPGTGESRKVLLLQHNYLGYTSAFVSFGVKSGRLPKNYLSSREDLRIFDRVETMVVATDQVQPWMLADYDTVIMEQVCDMRPFPPRFLQALTAWVAAGHKLIIHDADKCSGGPDYGWLPFRFKASIPGAMGAPGNTFRIIENSWMIHDVRGRPGFVDGTAWAALKPPVNELGDSNVITEWGPGWCGQAAVRNALGVFGFAQAYAHYGRGLIIWDGFDVDMTGTTWLDVVRARQLAQGFNTDNLPCGVKVGSFVILTEPQLQRRGVQPGQSYTYPLSVLPNLKYTGTVTLAVLGTPASAALDARVEPASVTVVGEQKATLTVAVPAGAKPAPMALEVKGTDGEGKTSTLCLQLDPAKTGGLSVISMLAPPTKTRKNLEIILDASGSMKALLGKRTRWDTALGTLQDVLAKLPDDFNVGLRMYGHREPSSSPKTCTDSELLVPIRKLDRVAMLKRASAFRPKGETPLVYSALQAPADLKPVGGGTVILITDGEESCNGDPAQAAAALKASGLDIRLNIVGFALNNPKTQQVLAAFAEATGGAFYAAQSGPALAEALLVAAVDRFPYTVFDAAGKQVAAGEAGFPAEQLPPGEYKVVVKAGAKELVAPRVPIALGQSVTLKIAMRAGKLVLE
jgi:hypothetical protein